MKKSILVAIAVLGLAGGYVLAADTCPAPSPALLRTVTVPGPNKTTEIFVVPVAGPGQKVEWVNETYKDLEPKIETVFEPRKRMVPKKYDVVHKKIVTDTKIDKVQPVNARQPRLARGKTLREKEYLKKETFMEEEDYLHPVKETVYYEVEKLRKVPALISEVDKK